MMTSYELIRSLRRQGGDIRLGREGKLEVRDCPEKLKPAIFRAILIVSNTTRDWSQLTLRVVVAYSEPSDRIVSLLQQLGEEIRRDPAYADDIVSEIQVPGIDRIGNGEAEYLMLIKTRPSKQYGVSRELRRRIKECFHKNNIQTAGLGKMYVIDQGAQAS
jgi:moderate conductance mechanosensitive channel